jgi:hypothetical protein
LLKEEESPEALLQSESSQENNIQSVNSGETSTADISPILSTNEQNLNEEGLELSESEKVLIMKASSLTASPEEIMAAMKLAAKKDKTTQSHDEDEETKETEI